MQQGDRQRLGTGQQGHQIAAHQAPLGGRQVQRLGAHQTDLIFEPAKIDGTPSLDQATSHAERLRHAIGESAQFGKECGCAGRMHHRGVKQTGVTKPFARRDWARLRDPINLTFT